jgi:hypothetical protein
MRQGEKRGADQSEGRYLNTSGQAGSEKPQDNLQKNPGGNQTHTKCRKVRATAIYFLQYGLHILLPVIRAGDAGPTYRTAPTFLKNRPI